MTDQDAYRRYTTEAESRFTMIENTELTDAQALVQAAIGQGWATLALAAAQERVQPADRPTDHETSALVNYIVVNEELVKPTQAAFAHQVVLRDDRGRRWRIVAGDDVLHWEAVPV